MAAERAGRWEDVRRALGRLFGRVNSHALPEARAGISTAVHQTSCLDLSGQAGAPRVEFRPSAPIRGLSALSATSGGGGTDLAAVVTTIGADRSLSRNEVTVRAASCGFNRTAVNAAVSRRDSLGVHALPVCPARAPVRRAVVTFGAPPTRVAPSVRAALRKPQRVEERVWQIAAARSRSDLASILRVPLTCPRLPAPPGVSPTAAFAPERLLLASASGVPLADVALIGVFPHVPLAAVYRLAVTPDGGALQIFLRPGAAGRAGGVTVSVVLGRQRSTGRMLQTARAGV